MKSFTPIQAVLRVSRKEYLTPNFLRVFLTGDAVPRFANTTVGMNNKILIPPKGVNEIHFPKMNKEEDAVPQEKQPIMRTYTHRGIDVEKKELWIDFVAHGDEGPASAWAIHAKKGDVLGVLMKDGKRALYTPADTYLLVGDATAIPVLSAILEDLPETAKGTCIIEVPSKNDEQKLQTKADIQFIWLHNNTPQQGSRLAETLKQQPLPEDNRFAYVAVEFDSVKAIRNYLRKEKKWPREELYAYSYWRSGVAENKSASDRKAEKLESN